MKPWNRFDALSIALFAALALLFYWRLLTPNLADRQSFPPGDFHAQFWAFATHEVRELSAGRLPLWNPYTFAGAPFWADVQAAVFYPPSLLTLLLSAPWGFSLFALEVEAIAHFWLAAILMYLFCREVTGSRPAAFIAALTFTFSGYLTGYPSQQLAVLEADVWLPLILFCLHRAGAAVCPAGVRPSPGPARTLYLPFTTLFWLVLAGAAWALTLLAGHPQSAFIVACISTAYLAFVTWGQGGRGAGEQGREGVWEYGGRGEEEQRSGGAEEQGRDLTPELSLPSPHTNHAPRFTVYALRFTLYFLLFTLTGLALAAIQFIPAVEYTLLSVRAEGTYDRMSGGFPLTDLIQILLPGQVSHYSPLYIGVVGLILALTAIFITPTRQTFFWGAVAFISLLISFGGNTFLYSPLYLFTPGFSIFRGQERWAFPAAFSLSLLTAYSLRPLLTDLPYSTTHHPPRTTHRSSFILHPSPFIPSSLLLFSFLLLFLFFYGLNDTGWSPESPFYGLLGAATRLSLLLFLVWLLWKFSRRLQPGLFIGLVAALVCLDLFSVNWRTNLYPQLPEWHTQMPALVQAIKADAAASPGEPYRVYNEFRLFDNYGVPFEIEDLWGASPLRPARYDEFLAPPMPIERTWELLNVKYVITWRQELFAPSTIIYQEPAADGTTYVHRLNQVGPRAWLVHQIEATDDSTTLQKIADPTFDRWRIALLEPGEAKDPSLNDLIASSSPLSLTHYSLLITHYSPQLLSTEVETPAPALLIFSEPYYPGWRATLDGQPVPLLRADYLLRAVPVPEGRHRVTLEFRPLSFIIGAIISLLGLGFVVTVLILAWRRRRIL